MQNLNIVDHNGEVMTDLSGNPWVVHTPLIAWIANYPEQLLIACMSSKNSPISTAIAKEFGNLEPSSPHLQQQTLDAIQEACQACDPYDIATFHKVCLSLCLNGIMQSFWDDWGNACPSLFLMPDALHQ